MTVRILDDALVNKIAAGEVVERPAAALKELVENSLDAGAQALTVELQGGGRSLIRVADDGSGMVRDDALMALERHATSKIRSFEDLVQAVSLGFRGEALPSIAAVSRLEILTRPRDQELGTRVRVEGGTLRDVTEAGCAVGTEITVRSLFYNLPVRRKFLRTVPTELGHCLEAITRLALLRPEVDWVVRHEGRDSIRAPRTDDPARRAADLLGREARSLFPVRGGELGVEVQGLISPVGVHRGSGAQALYLFVNGRFVRDAVLRRAVGEAYRGLVPKGRFPLVVLDVRLDPSRVDANVHPAKTEVRFRSPRDVQGVTIDVLRTALREHSARRDAPRAATAPSPPAPSTPAHPLDDPRFQGGLPLPPRPVDPLPSLRPAGPASRPEVQPASAPPPASAPSVAADGPPPAPGPAPTRQPAPTDLLPVPRFRDLRVIGQLSRTYILCEGGGELVVVDQHAAHERVTLHRLQAQRGELSAVQQLLTPVVVELTRAQVEFLRGHADVLDSLALRVEPMGPSSVAVRAVPALLAGGDPDALVRDLADSLAVDAGPSPTHDLEDRVLATMSCHTSVRAGAELSHHEQRALLASLDEVDFEVCAHGRPVALRITTAELERRFYRS